MAERRFYRFADLVEAGVVNNRQTLSNWIKRHGFPAPVHLGPNTAAWPVEEVERWLRARAAAREREAASASDSRTETAAERGCVRQSTTVEQERRPE